MCNFFAVTANLVTKKIKKFFKVACLKFFISRAAPPLPFLSLEAFFNIDTLL